MEKSITTKVKSSDKTKRNEEKRTSVREIENGFVITRNHNWEDKDGRYHSDCKEWFSKENPLATVDKALADNF